MRGPLRLCHVFPGFGPGGSQVRTAKLVAGAGDAFEHTIISLDGDVRSADGLGDRVPMQTVTPGSLGRLAPVTLAGILRPLRPHLVLTYNWGAIDGVVAGRLGGWPVIHHEDGFNPDEMDGQKRRRVLARRLLLRTVQTVVVPSRTLADVARRDWRVAGHRLAYVPNGVDLARFRPGDADGLRAALGAAPGEVVVGTVGHLNTGKNVAMLLRAAAALPDPRVRLLVLGEGPERGALTRLARELGIDDRLCLAGHVPDPADHFRAMDVFAMTSRTEQMPVSVLEAMATGLPVVATDVGDLRHMVPGADEGLITPRDDLERFTGALWRVVREDALRHRLGAANRACCETAFGEPEMIERHADLWLRAAGAAERETGLRAGR